MEDVTGATPFELAPMEGGDVVEQLNSAAARTAWVWWVTGAAVLLGLLTLPWGLILRAVLAPVCVWLVLNDRARKTVVVFYDVEDEHFSWFDSLVRTWAWLSGSQRMWRVLRSGNVATTYQFKTNSGASPLVNSPGSDADARAVHGIDDSDLVGAPTIKQVLDEALAFLAGTVLVAHNCDFEERFLTAAAHRAYTTLPKMVGLCTLQSSRRQLEGRAFSLTAMYRPRPEAGRISGIPRSATLGRCAKCCFGFCAAHRNRSTSRKVRRRQVRRRSTNVPSAAGPSRSRDAQLPSYWIHSPNRRTHAPATPSRPRSTPRCSPKQSTTDDSLTRKLTPSPDRHA